MNKKIKLKELCIEDEWGKYGIPASAEKFDINKTRYLRITDISEDGELLNNDVKSVSAPDIDKYILKEGDIVFARTGNSTGKSYYHESKNGDLAFAGFLIKYSLDKTKINPKYLKFFTITNEYKNWVKNLSVGSTRGNINAQTFGDCPISVPERKQQDLLVSSLSLIIYKIELNNRINAELEAMAKTLYDYWFVQFDFPDKNRKPYKTSGGKMVWNEELKREIPEGWDSVMIENCLLKESSIRKIPTAEILEKGKFPVIDQSTHYITGFTNDKEAIIKTDVPRIIFGDHTRILKLINFDFARGADGTQVMLSNNKRMPQHLFFNTLLKIDLSNYGYARHYKFLKDISIILPDETVSKSFEAIVSPFYTMIRENIFQNQKLTELRDWILPMLMNGQVKVN